MVSGDGDLATQDPREQAIVDVATRALRFGAESAEHVGNDPFEDPILHTYFLLYVLGAVDYIGDHHDPARPLDPAEKLSAMAQALGFFGTASIEEIRGTVIMLDRAADTPALTTKAAGAAAAAEWLHGDGAASRRFHEMMQDPANFPRDVDPVRHDPADLD